MHKIKIAHIINPVKVPESSDLFVAQPVTFETMRRAKEFAKDKVDVTLLTTQYPEDCEIIPDYFIRTENLKRSVLDVGTFVKQRKLPILQDILARAVEFDTNSDYIVYTNVDIALMPHFYLFINQKIKEGFDAFVINRRTISKDFTLETLDVAYSDLGKKHPGFDCFVFKKDAFSSFHLDLVCIGTTRIGLALIANLIMFSSKFKIFLDEHVTFHLGEDRIWENQNYLDFVKHNEDQVLGILKRLEDFDSIKFGKNALLNKYKEKLLLNYNKKQTDEKVTLFKKIFKNK
jgi:hypothetical protein